jgi:hypothetical protein
MSSARGTNPVVDDLVDAALAFTLALRSREGFNDELYGKLVDALTRCAQEWRDEECIPRLAVNVLVDVQPVMLASAEFYERDLRSHIMEEAIRIGDVVRDAVAV